MKKIVALFLFVVTSGYLYSNPVSPDIAKQVAVNYFKHFGNPIAQNISIINSQENKVGNNTTYYSFEFEGGGWMLVSADDVAIPVLAYSPEGSIIDQAINPEVKFWLDNCNTQLINLINKKADNSTTAKIWKNYLAGVFDVTGLSVAPLTKTTWNQDQYYNALCPLANQPLFGYDGRVPTGCVATTMAQLMKYYNYPSTGIGSNTYNSAYGQLTANFGNTTYNWTNMPNNATTYNNDIATLMSQAGIAVDMDYGDQGSAANNVSALNALVNFFNYDPSIQYVQEALVSTLDEWLATIKIELDAARPVYYSGSNATEGHAWVCDGYDNNIPSNLHMNWGWGGYYNGYYAVGNFNAGPGSNFNHNNNIITGIKPRTNPNFICRISSPNDGDNYNIGQTVSISVSALKGSPTKTYLIVDGISKDSTTTMPANFSLSTTGLSFGPHTIKINAFDGSGYSSHQISININSNYWSKIDIPSTLDSVKVEHINFAGTDTIWANLYDYSSQGNSIRKFIKSSDGGATWTFGSLECTGCTGLEIDNIHAISATKAYASLNPGNNSGGLVVVTTDGGQTWTPQTTADFTNSWADWIYFFDVNNGVCMGDSYNGRFYVFTTQNGGTTWNRVSTTNLPAALVGEAGTVDFYDAIGNNIWFGTGNGRIYRSTDKGLTWKVSDTNMGAVQADVKFRDALNGLAFGGSTTLPFVVSKTTDGGVTWKSFSPNGDSYGISFSYIPGTNADWINSSVYGTSLSFNDDSTFYWIDSSNPVNTVKFADANHGWAGGYFTKANKGGLFKWVGNLTPTNNSNVTVIVKDAAGNLIQGAKVECNYDTVITNANGAANFAVVNLGNPSYYIVSKTGFSTVSSPVNISNNMTITVVLPATFNVTFTVKNGAGNGIPNVNILFQGNTQPTDNTGSTTFTNVEVGQGLLYSISNTNYYTGYGTLDVVNSNVTKVITLAMVAVNEIAVPQVNVYPNPANNRLNITMNDKINSVKIFNISGQMIFNKNYASESVQLDVSQFESGIYIMQINDGKSTKNQKLIIAK